MKSQKYLGNKIKILSSLLILAVVVAFGILLSSMPLPFQLSRVSADSSDTFTDQELGQENTGSGDTLNKNRITNDIGIEESATLSVCKEIASGSPDVSMPSDFAFTVTGNDPSPAQFLGDPNCVDITIGPGEYTVSEVLDPDAEGGLASADIEGECIEDPNTPFDEARATGEIQAGETQECRFINLVGS